MPHSPFLSAAQNLSTPVPKGVTTPWPVTTTRLRPLVCVMVVLSRNSKLGRGPRKASVRKMAGSSRCAGCLRLRDDALHAIHDGANGRERFYFFIRIIWDFDAEGILNIEHDHGKVERLNLKFAEGRFERDGFRRVLHVLTQNLNDLRRHLIHIALPAPLRGPCLMVPG